MAPVTLIKNGTVLIHDASNHVVSTRSDILIRNGRVAKLAANIEPIDNASLIDATDKIISPGFIDTHHHGWQTQLKGRHANELLLQYMISGAYSCTTFKQPSRPAEIR
jgi:cytosine/adenosine deaminase-related metal-dependent hydrolase